MWPTFWTVIQVIHVNMINDVLVSSAVDRGFESRSGHTKDYEIGMYCFSAKHTALRKKSKDCLIRNQDNIFQLYHGENQLILIKMMRPALY
jgi:hypothetical protein